ncbi:MAG: glycosyltransferase family 39 protein [Deltaproteobacteria bacterium]|nr:glycosyltransferase family 39 protein [Deltaproteobacteria bacterium]
MQAQAFPFVAFLSVVWLVCVCALLSACKAVLQWGLQARSEEENSFQALSFLSLILVTAMAVLWVTPYQASNLGISDSVEYAVAAERMLNQGTYSLQIEGHNLPPRYAPWFSALFIVPSMILTSPNLGNSIWPILVFAMLGVSIAFCVGRRLSGNWGGILSAFAVLLDPGYRYFSKFPMTDVPSAVLVLLILTLCLVVTTRKEKSDWSFLTLGVLCALVASLRITSVLVVVPVLWAAVFAVEKKGMLKRLLLALSPVLFFFAVQAVYQLAIFGSPLRSGYEFWVPWPYDFFSKVFSLNYLATNLATLSLHTPTVLFVVLFLAGWPVLREKQGAARLDREAFFRFFRLVGYFAVPLVALYLLYFYSTSRFYLPMSVALYALIGSFIGAFLGPIEKHRVPALVCLLVIAAGAAGWRSSAPIDPPARRIAADIMARTTANDALIVTGLDPVYLEPLVLRGTTRTVLPISRRIEYASKVVAWAPLYYREPYPQDLTTLPREYLLEAGGRDVVSSVALDGDDVVGTALASGRPVYIETSALEPGELKQFTDRFTMLEMGKGLFQVTGTWGNS